MNKFEYRRNDHQDLLGCETCACEVPLAEFRAIHGPHMRLLCEVCAVTTIGMGYKEVTPRMLAEVANHLLTKLGAH